MGLTTEQQERVVAEAMTWVGTPFHHMARLKGVGVDCAQLLIGVYVAAGILADFQPDAYPPDWHLHQGGERYLDYIQRYCDPVSTGDPLEPGDVLTYRRTWRSVGHAGIYIGGGRLIHALEPAGKVMVDDVGSRFLARWFAGAWRIQNGVA